MSVFKILLTTWGPYYRFIQLDMPLVNRALIYLILTLKASLSVDFAEFHSPQSLPQQVFQEGAKTER